MTWDNTKEFESLLRRHDDLKMPDTMKQRIRGNLHNLTVPSPSRKTHRSWQTVYNGIAAAAMLMVAGVGAFVVVYHNSHKQSEAVSTKPYDYAQWFTFAPILPVSSTSYSLHSTEVDINDTSGARVWTESLFNANYQSDYGTFTVNEVTVPDTFHRYNVPQSLHKINLGGHTVYEGSSYGYVIEFQRMSNVGPYWVQLFTQAQSKGMRKQLKNIAVHMEHKVTMPPDRVEFVTSDIQDGHNFLSSFQPILPTNLPTGMESSPPSAYIYKEGNSERWTFGEEFVYPNPKTDLVGENPRTGEFTSGFGFAVQEQYGSSFSTLKNATTTALNGIGVQIASGSDQNIKAQWYSPKKHIEVRVTGRLPGGKTQFVNVIGSMLSGS
jgi:hypothetical protein